MKAFVSSLIGGMGPVRQAARDAVETARFTPVMAEDFGALPTTPQVACLTGLRQADVVVLILGASYGAEQPSGLSATHEEWRDAKDRKPILVFVEEGVDPDTRQIAFVQEVEAWADGRFRAGFRTPRELQIVVGQALFDFERSNAVGAVDQPEMLARAAGLLPVSRSGMSSSTPVLAIAIAAAPKQKILRPIEIEDQALWEAMHQAAMFGDTRIFDHALGVRKGMDGSVFELTQDRGGSILLDEEGDLRITLPIQRGGERMGVSALIEEEIRRVLISVLGYMSWTLERIDPTQRLTHAALATRISGGEYLPWFTQAEMAASNGSYSTGFGSGERPVVQVTTTRAALRLDRTRMVEDLLVPLRRQWKPNGGRG